MVPTTETGTELSPKRELVRKIGAPLEFRRVNYIRQKMRPSDMYACDHIRQEMNRNVSKRDPLCARLKLHGMTA